MKVKTQIKLIGLLCLLSTKLLAQDVVHSTKISQRASITQRIGTTDVTIVYHSPLVKGRKIFGGVVPFDFVVDGKEYVWRSGSNQNTTISFSHDVTIDGKALAAGTYGLHVFVSEKEWTFIFSNKNDSWGSFQYDKNLDALRVKVPTEKAIFQEWLSYNFTNRQAESAEVELRWEETSASFRIQTDVTQNILSDLSKKVDKTANDFLIMAKRTLQKDSNNIQEAMRYINESISVEKKFSNQIFKADLMIQNGETKLGKALRKEVLAAAKDFDMYYYGLSSLLVDNNKEKSHRLLRDYAKRKPKDWIAHLALGEYYLKDDKQDLVVQHFEKAYQYAPDNWKNYARYLYLANKIILD